MVEVLIENGKKYFQVSSFDTDNYSDLDHHWSINLMKEIEVPYIIAFTEKEIGEDSICIDALYLYVLEDFWKQACVALYPGINEQYFKLP